MKSAFALYGLIIITFFILVMIATSIMLIIDKVEKIEKQTSYIESQFINTKLELCE